MSPPVAGAPRAGATREAEHKVSAYRQRDHRMFNRAARARSWVAVAVTMKGQRHGIAAPAPSAVKHPDATFAGGLRRKRLPAA
jgi:hypothetical protein